MSYTEKLSNAFIGICLLVLIVVPLLILSGCALGNGARVDWKPVIPVTLSVYNRGGSTEANADEAGRDTLDETGIGTQGGGAVDAKADLTP